MIIETEADFDTLAALDAETRDLSGLTFPTRAEVENGEPAPVAEQFTIDSEDRANWLLGKLAAIDAEAARIKAQAEARANELRADRERLLSRFGSELETFARMEAERRRRKTVSLLQGSLSFRTVPARLVIADGEAAFANARTVCPQAIIEQTTVRLDTAAYIAFAEQTGDFTGLETQPAREAFAVKFPGAKEGRNTAQIAPD